MINANSHSSAGASSSPSTRRRYPTAVAGVSGTGIGSRKTDRPLRIKAEADARAGLQVGIGPGLWQRNAELDMTLQLPQQHRGVGTVEEQADHLAGMRDLFGRQVGRGAAQQRGLGPDERLNGHTRRNGPLTARAHRSEEHTSELQSHSELVCRLLLEKK